MARFRFECVDAGGEPYAVTPMLAFTIRRAGRELDAEAPATSAVP